VNNELTDWPILKKLNLCKNDDFFGQVKSGHDDKIQNLMICSLLRTELIDFSENKCLNLISFIQLIAEYVKDGI
jgi:hypothetical protein